MANLLDNPALNIGAGDPWIPSGWSNTGLDSGDTQSSSTGGAVYHSGSECMQWNTGAVASEKITQQITLASGKFFRFSIWTYGDGSAGFVINAVNAVLQANPLSSSLTTPHTAAWSQTKGVFRATSANPTIEIEADSGAAGNRYTADLSVTTNDDVSLTCTPASAANSVESSGIRVDGYDSAPQTIPANSIFANQGWIKFAWIPRHSAADVAKFGNATPAIAQIYGDADDYITLDWSAANTIRLRYNANGAGVQTGTWDATGAIVAGTTYQMEIKYLPSGMELIVDGTTRITITAAVAFGTVPTSFYPGSLQAGGSQVDAVFLAPT